MCKKETVESPFYAKNGKKHPPKKQFKINLLHNISLPFDLCYTGMVLLSSKSYKLPFQTPKISS